MDLNLQIQNSSSFGGIPWLVTIIQWSISCFVWLCLLSNFIQLLTKSFWIHLWCESLSLIYQFSQSLTTFKLLFFSFFLFCTCQCIMRLTPLVSILKCRFWKLLIKMKMMFPKCCFENANVFKVVFNENNVIKVVFCENNVNAFSIVL